MSKKLKNDGCEEELLEAFRWELFSNSILSVFQSTYNSEARNIKNESKELKDFHGKFMLELLFKNGNQSRWLQFL